MTVVLLKDRIDHHLGPEAPRVITLSAGGRSLARAGPSVLARATRAARASDLVVAGMEWAPTFFGCASAFLSHRPVVAIVQTHLRRYSELEPVPRSWMAAMRLSLRSCAAVVAVSEDVRRSVTDLGIDDGRVRVIPNPGPTPIPSANTHAGKPRIVTVAGLKPIKGVDVAIRAAAHLKDMEFDWTIVGEGPLRGDLQRLAVAGGIADRVTLRGFDPDPHQYLAEADLFVLPSRVEGNPLALVEAMAAGLPVVATRCATAVEEHLSGGAGVLVPVDDASAMATAIRSLLTDPASREQMGRAARERSAAFTPAAIAKQYDALFAEVLGR